LAKEQTDARCENVWEVLSSWMVTFKTLEENIGKTHIQMKAMEEYQDEMAKSLEEFTGLCVDQGEMICLLQARVGELELGHGVLQDHVLHIEVGGQ
jgi:hypothetical protein